jgi:hypothetical protein
MSTNKKPEYADLHWNIRFGILSLLYDRYFSDEIDKTILVNPDLVNMLSMSEIDQTLIFGDVIYLHRKHLIEGTPGFGSHYPYRVRIDISGIEAIEQIVDASLSQITTANNVKEVTMELDKKAKFKKFRDLVGENASIIELIVNVTKSFFMGG